AGAVVLAGVGMGLGLGTHLMAVPLAVAVVLGLLREGTAWRGRVGPGGGVVLAAAAGVLPRLPGRSLQGGLPAAAAAPAGARAPAADMGAAGRVGRTLGALVTPFAQTAGLGLGYYFDGEWPRFTAERTAPALLRGIGPVVATVVGLGTLLGLVVGLRAQSPAHRRVARLARWTWGVHAAFPGRVPRPPAPRPP